MLKFGPTGSARWTGLVLILVVVATYWPALSAGFLFWDDPINVTGNPLLTAPWSAEVWRQLFDGNQALRFKPVHWLLFRGMHGAFGFQLAAWHALGLTLHALAALGFYGLLLRMIRTTQPALTSGATLAAFAGTALWALHPLRVEPVAWVTGSTYPLTTLLLIGSFYCYLRAHEPGCGAHRSWLGVSWVLALLAYGSYPVGITYGLWLMAVDWWWLRIGPGRDNRSLVPAPAWLAKHAVFLLPAAVAVGFTLWSRITTPGLFTAAPSLETVGGGLRLLTALASLSFLAGNAFWPANLTPNHVPITFTAGEQVELLVLAALAALGLTWAWLRRRTRPGLALAVIGGAALSLPCLGLTERPTWPVDRYSYLVHLVLAGTAALGLATGPLARLKTAPAAALLGLLVAGSILATRGQLAMWRDNDAFFTHLTSAPEAAAHPRQQAHLHILWARAEAEAGHMARASELRDRARELYMDAVNAAVCAGRPGAALEVAANIEAYFGPSGTLHREKGNWLLQLGRREEALRELRLAERELPGDARTQALLHAALSMPP